MWRRTYLILLAIRLYFALAPSYLHPDEHFQGPEPIAGAIFHYPVVRTWEFDSSAPVRSVFPLWIVYGLPMWALKCLCDGAGRADVPPLLVYSALRLIVFALGFVVQDWALHELIDRKSHRRFALLVVASSYVTLTYQTHTFSNSIESILVLWSLVVMAKIVRDGPVASVVSPIVLGFLTVLGIFNRITFVAFMAVPFAFFLLHLLRRPLVLASFLVAVIATTAIAILTDTSFYRPDVASSFRRLAFDPVVAPYNLLMYNLSHANLAQHGLHPYYHHFLANLPLLLGPAVLLVANGLFITVIKQYRRFSRRSRPSSPSSSNDSSGLSRDGKSRLFSNPAASFFSSSIFVPTALVGCLLLSALPHQEARFLLPAVPLLLASIRRPRNNRIRRVWLAAWFAFNAILALVMGVYHQGGVVPVQAWLGDRFGHGSVISFDHVSTASQLTVNVPEVVWWKTYSPPTWLMNGANAHVATSDLMGSSADLLIQKILSTRFTCVEPDLIGNSPNQTAIPDALVVVAPLVADLQVVLRDIAIEDSSPDAATSQLPYHIHREHYVHHHIGLDDLDFATDGVFGTLFKLIRKRGLVVWSVRPRPETCKLITPLDTPQVDDVSSPNRKVGSGTALTESSPVNDHSGVEDTPNT